MVIAKAVMSVPKIPAPSLNGDAQLDALMKLVWRDALTGMLSAGTEVKAAIRQADIAAVAAVRRFGHPHSIISLNGMELASVIEHFGGFPKDTKVGMVWEGEFRTGVLLEHYPVQGMVRVRWEVPGECEEDDLPISACVCVL